MAVVSATQSTGKDFSGAVFDPGISVDGAVSNAKEFIEENRTGDDDIIIYGYSYGGDAAVELASSLNEDGIGVNLLITVDAADGPLMGTTTDRIVPENVEVNVNEFQTANSVIGSRGDKNKAANPSKTFGVFNINVGNFVEGVVHNNIDEITTDFNISLINQTITGQTQSTASFGTPVNSSNSSSVRVAEGTSATSSGSSSSSSFNEKRKSSN